MSILLSGVICYCVVCAILKALLLRFELLIQDTDVEKEEIRHRTKNNSFTVWNLDTCESYKFGIVTLGSSGYGPLKTMATIQTGGNNFDFPPKHVDIQFSTDNLTDADIVWSPPCNPGNSTLDYRITIQDLSFSATTVLILSDNKNKVRLRQTFHWGAKYNLSIQLEHPGAPAFGPILVSGPPLPSPDQLTIQKQDNGDLLLHWRDPDLDPELIAHGYSYLVYLSSSLEVFSS